MYNNDTTSFSLMEDDDKILLLCPSAVSFSNLDLQLETANVDSPIVLVALLIATVATIF